MTFAAETLEGNLSCILLTAEFHSSGLTKSIHTADLEASPMEPWGNGQRGALPRKTLLGAETGALGFYYRETVKVDNKTCFLENIKGESRVIFCLLKLI